jgi:hypothetical protein
MCQGHIGLCDHVFHYFLCFFSIGLFNIWHSSRRISSLSIFSVSHSCRDHRLSIQIVSSIRMFRPSSSETHIPSRVICWFTRHRNHWFNAHPSLNELFYVCFSYTLFLVILGTFDFEALQQAHRILGNHS